jgi:hypothetical protein
VSAVKLSTRTGSLSMIAGEHGEAGKDERAHLVGLPDQLLGSLPSFRTLKQAFRDLMSFCRALDGCSPWAAALEDAHLMVPLTYPQ